MKNRLSLPPRITPLAMLAATLTAGPALLLPAFSLESQPPAANRSTPQLSPLAIGDGPVSTPIAPPEITQQPLSGTVTEGENIWFFVEVSSPGPFTCQWRRNGVDLLDATNPTLPLLQTIPWDSGAYDVVVANAGGSVTSAVAQLTVQYRPPSLQGGPYDTVAVLGGGLHFYATARGWPPLSIQWYKNREPLPDQTDADLAITGLQSSDAGAYFLVVTNPQGAATSAVARVTLVPAIVYGPYAPTAYLGNATELTANFNAAVPTSLQWFFNETPLPGATNSLLQFPAAEPQDSGLYFFVAANAFGSVTSQVAALDVQVQVPMVTVSQFLPGDRAPRIGDQIFLTGSVQAGPPATLQWWRDGELLPGQTNLSLCIAHASTNDNGSYFLTASNLLGTTSSEPRMLLVGAEPAQFLQSAGPATNPVGSIVMLSALAAGGPPPTYQWSKDGVDIPGATSPTLVLPAPHPPKPAPTSSPP